MVSFVRVAQCAKPYLIEVLAEADLDRSIQFVDLKREHDREEAFVPLAVVHYAAAIPPWRERNPSRRWKWTVCACDLARAAGRCDLPPMAIVLIPDGCEIVRLGHSAIAQIDDAPFLCSLMAVELSHDSVSTSIYCAPVAAPVSVDSDSARHF